MILAQISRPLLEPGWIPGRLDRVWEAVVEHLLLTGIAVGGGLLIATVLAGFILRWRILYGPVVAVTGVFYTIPSLALFALLVPFTGLTRTTASVALVSYTLLVLVRNIVVGIDGVPADVKEAALGMGYTRWRLLREVELPLALPAIIAGIRIATVTIVGLVTVTALIGLGGLGSLILDGVRRGILFPTPVVVGTVLSAVLAAVLDLCFLTIQRALTPWAARGEGT